MKIYDSYRKAASQMKITATLLTLFALFSPTIPAQEYVQWELPEGTIVRLGKGSMNAIQYAPNRARLAVATSIGIWLYDTTTYYREVALLTGHTDMVESITFSPDRKNPCQWESGRDGAPVKNH